MDNGDCLFVVSGRLYGNRIHAVDKRSVSHEGTILKNGNYAMYKTAIFANQGDTCFQQPQ